MCKFISFANDLFFLIAVPKKINHSSKEKDLDTKAQTKMMT